MGWRRTLSSRAIFWLIFGTGMLSIIPSSLYYATDALKQDRVAHRLLAIAMADRDVFEAAQAIMFARGNITLALVDGQSATPQTDTALISSLRHKLAENIADATQRLNKLGLSGLAAEIDPAYRTFSATWTAADAALGLPLPARDPSLNGRTLETSDNAIKTLLNICFRLDNLIRPENPALNTLIEIKERLMVTRQQFGSVDLATTVALALHQTWSRVELAQNSRAGGAGEMVWHSFRVLIAELQDAPNLTAAVGKAIDAYDRGPAVELRDSVWAGMIAETPPTIDAAAWIGTEIAAVRLIGKAASAADDDVVAGSEKLERSSERTLMIRCAGLALALALFGVGLWGDRSLQSRKTQRQAAANEERLRLEEGERQLTAERVVAADAVRQVVASIGAGLARLAAGDLSYRLTTPLPPSYEALRVDLNSAFDALEAMVSHIASGTGSIRLGIDRIAKEADDLNQRTEQQASRLAATVSAMSQITAMIGKTVESADDAARIVAETKSGAEQSGEVVLEAIAAVAGIEHASEQISQIVRVIDSIAMQTNLLALNAGIEAARAGDAGRGFAVVAGEVRQLASRSQAAAKQIKDLISTATQQVGLGVRLVDATGKSFVRIVHQVGGISEAVLTIAASAKAQALGLAEVNASISQLDDMTHQNACMVDQSTAASHELARETEALVRLTGRFRT